MVHGFTEKEQESYVDALNYIATEAKFSNVDTVKGAIELYKHFSTLQSIAQKISNHILEVRKLHTPDKEEAKLAKKGKK